MASRYITHNNRAESFGFDDGLLDNLTISGDSETADDIPLLFNELRERYSEDTVGDFQRPSDGSTAERDALNAFDDAIHNLHDANADKNKSCASCSKEVRVESVSSFRRGQHISMPGQKLRSYDKYTHKLIHRYKHHAIIKQIKRRSGTRIEMELIHFTKEDGNIKICQSVNTYDLAHDELYIVEYIHPRYTADEVISRAESMLPANNGDQHTFGTYNPGTNNCEHFATWCVVGEGESFQSQNFRTKIADLIQRIFGAGTKIAKMLMRILYISSDEIAASLTSSLNIPEIVLAGTAALYLIYCIFMTVVHLKDFYNGQLCKTCLKGKLQDLWITFAVFGTTSIVTFVVLNFALPLLATPVGVPLIIILVLLSIALQWSVPKVRKAFQSPFIVDKKEVRQISEVEIGDAALLKYYGIEHAIIVTEVHEEGTDSMKGRIRGVHYGLPNIFGRREVMEEYFTIDLTKSTLKRFDCSHLLTNTPETTVQRARKRVGEKKWALASNRSDHFCFWAKVQQRPSGICENWDNGDLEGSSTSTNNLSSLHLEQKEVHLENDLVLGDVIKYKQVGILVGKINLDPGRGRQLKIEMIVYDLGWYCRKKVHIVDLNKDSIVIERCHPAHCHPMAVRVERAKSLEDTHGPWWTDKGFIEHCIMLNP